MIIWFALPFCFSWISKLMCYEPFEICLEISNIFDTKNAASEHAYKDILTSLPKPGGGEYGKYYSLPALNDPRIGMVPREENCLLWRPLSIFSCNEFLVKVTHFRNIADKLPYSVRILLESAIRNCDNYQVTKDDVEKILDWENTSTKQVEIAFKPARVILQVCSMIFLFFCSSSLF